MTALKVGFDADLLDGRHGSYYLNASNMASGNLPYARMPTGSGSWDTGVGTTITVTGALTVSEGPLEVSANGIVVGIDPGSAPADVYLILGGSGGVGGEIWFGNGNQPSIDNNANAGLAIWNSGLTHDWKAFEFITNSSSMLRGNSSDGVSALGVVIDNFTALTGAGAGQRIASFQNAGVEKASIAWDGGATFAGAVSMGALTATTGVVTPGADGTAFTVRRGAGTNNPGMFVSTIEASARTRLDFSGSAGGFNAMFAIGNNDVLALDAAALKPATAGGLTLGTAALPWKDPHFGFDASNRLDITISSAGLVTYDAVGASAKHLFSDDVDLASSKVYRVNGTQVVSAQGAAVADATDAASAITQLNAWLARARSHGLIAT